jgi:hypothetical protein
VRLLPVRVSGLLVLQERPALEAGLHRLLSAVLEPLPAVLEPAAVAQRVLMQPALEPPVSRANEWFPSSALKEEVSISRRFRAWFPTYRREAAC